MFLKKEKNNKTREENHKLIKPTNQQKSPLVTMAMKI